MRRTKSPVTPEWGSHSIPTASKTAESQGVRCVVASKAIA